MRQCQHGIVSLAIILEDIAGYWRQLCVWSVSLSCWVRRCWGAQLISRVGAALSPGRRQGLRIIERSVSGSDRDIYAFALVLEETQGSAITFTNLEYTVSQPEINPAGVSYHSSILWKLRSGGELRQPFSFYWDCGDRQCPNWVATALWYNIILTGTNTQGQPIQVAIDLKLPQNPPKLQRGLSPATLAASPLSTASVPGSDSGPVPFQTVGNHVLVSALLNQKEHATLLVDTGASHTFLTPDAAKRLGASPAADAPKHTTTVVGGRQVEFPLVLLSNIAVGQA
ncbi:MAG TPA: retropepsin-like aspartic protease [Candidatus Saccharimonadia bacterium]|nr:retropepsin-like aspartic protease [Candidatus Saccharimonadia bacterium]